MPRSTRTLTVRTDEAADIAVKLGFKLLEKKRRPAQGFNADMKCTAFSEVLRQADIAYATFGLAGWKPKVYDKTNLNFQMMKDDTYLVIGVYGDGVHLYCEEAG